MGYFNEKNIKTKLDILLSKQVHILDQVGTDYCLVYCHFPLDNKKDYFEFTGIPIGKTFPEKLFTEKDLPTIMKRIKEYYPLMKPNDWDTYKKLNEKAKEASSTCYTSMNDTTREKEDKAIQKLCDFVKSHGL